MEKEFDLIVIGAGPAGMISAIRASQLKLKVALLEKNEKLGSKLLLTGGQRSNITKAEFDNKAFAKNYGKQGDFILHALSIFGPKQLIEFFESRGLKTKIEKENRVFPESNSANDVLNLLISELNKNKVEIITKAKVERIVKEGNKIVGVVLAGGRELCARKYILSTGGKSYPATGSTGEGFKWAKELGHSIVEPKPSLSPINIKDEFVKEAQGVSLKDAKLTFLQDGKKKQSIVGDMMFAHFGLSGPAILNLSRSISKYLENGEVKLVLDIYPDLDIEKLDKKIQDLFSKDINKTFKNCLLDLLQPKLALVIINLSKIDPLKKVNAITKEERRGLVDILKKIEMTVDSLMGFEQALITDGGVMLKEIDSKTMKSKLIDNLFFAGEIIDLSGPTGGYNLQLCWSTGYLAGESAK